MDHRILVGESSFCELVLALYTIDEVGIEEQEKIEEIVGDDDSDWGSDETRSNPCRTC